jgi:hypothetical protein
MKLALSDKAVHFIPNSGMTTVVVSMVTKHIAVCYENYAFTQSRLFHSESVQYDKSAILLVITISSDRSSIFML